MPEFQTGDIVRVEMPRGYSGRGILGISLLFSTSPESRFEGAIGTVTEINPVGPQMVHQYLVDFRTHDNSRIGIPWQAQWFREEWLALKERPESVSAKAAQDTPEATWPERADEAAVAGGIAHPGAKIFTEGRTDFAPPGLDPETATGTVPDAAYGIGSSGPITDETNSTTDSSQDTSPRHDGSTTMTASSGAILEQGDAYVRVQGMQDCPEEFPIKGNESSGIYHVPGSASYEGTVPEICFDSIDTAAANGFRAARGSAAPASQKSAAPEQSTAFTGVDRQDDRSGLDAPAFASAETEMGIAAAPASSDLITERGEGFVKVQGMSVCPDGFPIKGNANSGIFHAPTDASYARTIPEICFATEDIAAANGFRPPARRG